MKPKNVMLLGFVNKAVEYLDEHLDDEADPKLAELKNIDLASLREELNENLGLTLGTMQSTMTTLLHAGDEAFDKFVESTGEVSRVSRKADKVFAAGFDGDDKNENERELAKLLAFYNLDTDFDIDDEFEEEEEDNRFSSDEESRYVVIKEPKKKPKKSKVMIVPDESELFEEDEEPVQIETAEVIENDLGDEEIAEVDVENSNEDELLKQIQKNINDADNPEVTIAKDENIEKDIDSILSEIEGHDEKKVPAEEKENPVEDLEQLFEEQAITEKNLSSEETEYVNSLIDELKQQMDKEDNQKLKKEEEDKEIYEKVHGIYPYLSERFVTAIYGLKEQLASEYPNGKKIIVLHRLSFNDVEDLRQFVEIVLNHNYNINADEEKMIVDVFKEHVNADGKILTNIFEIANQGSLLNATYDGYNVLIMENE